MEFRVQASVRELSFVALRSLVSLAFAGPLRLWFCLTDPAQLAVAHHRPGQRADRRRGHDFRLKRSGDGIVLKYQRNLFAAADSNKAPLRCGFFEEDPMKLIIWVLWPAFIAAGIAEIVFFTVIDPQQLFLLGQPVALSAINTYSIGFLLFWLLCSGSSLMTWLMLPRDIKSALSCRAAEAGDPATRQSSRQKSAG
jgi:hypothetical protein